ncbi:STAS domain-containing protein [Nocardia brasiliensis]
MTTVVVNAYIVAMPLQITLDCYADAVVMTGRGDIRVAATAGLVTALRRVVAMSKPLIVIDFSRIGYCGSAGLAALVLAARTAAPRPVRIVPSVQIRRSLRAGGLDRVLVLCPDVVTARAT